MCGFGGDLDWEYRSVGKGYGTLIRCTNSWPSAGGGGLANLDTYTPFFP